MKKPAEKGAPPPEEVRVEHPLFPVEEDEAIPDISFITIGRWERGKMYTGATLPASEVTDVAQIFALYGGGDYILQGRGRSISYEGMPGRVTRQKKINVPGRPRPMSQSPTEEELGEVPQARRAEPSGLGGGDGMTQVMLAMFQGQQAAAQAAQAQAQQQSQQFMQMMVAMMQGSKSESAQMTTLMMQMSQQQSQSMMQMVTAMMANRGGGPEEMAKYAELMRTLGMGGKGEDEVKTEDMGSMLENIADIATAITSMRGGGQLPPSEPGSAASVLAEMQPFPASVAMGTQKK